jgi:hypothetical protein
MLNIAILKASLIICFAGPFILLVFELKTALLPTSLAVMTLWCLKIALS